MKNRRIHILFTLLLLAASASMLAAPKTVTLNQSFCEPVDFLVGCEVLNTAGRHEVQVTEDSTVIVNLTFGIPVTYVSASINKGEQFLYGCNAFTEAGEYPDTLISVGGCDSIVVLQLTFSACDTAYSNLLQTLCEKELPYTYIGAKEFVITSDTTIQDTVIGGAASGCDSIATIQFVVNRLVATTPENKVICGGDTYTWRGKQYSETGQYIDSVRYAVSGCDSAIYVLNLKVNRLVPTTPEDTTICPSEQIQWHGKQIGKGIHFDTIRYAATGCDSAIYKIEVKTYPVQYGLVVDTLCLNAAKTKYPRLKITGTGTYRDTLVSAVTHCDSVVTYHIRILDNPTMPRLEFFVDNWITLICGKAMDPEPLVSAVKEAAKVQPVATAKFEDIWLEVKMTPTSQFVKVTNQAIAAGADQIELRLAGRSECDATTIYGSPVSRDVAAPTPDNTPELDKMPAVSKYNNWLLMIHYNRLSDWGYEIEPEDVTWYQVYGDVDKADDIVNDKIVGYGYYYTADQSLTSRYYAIIRDRMSACGAVLRTVVIDCKANRMELTPRAIRAGEAITLSNLDMSQQAEIRIFATDGKMLRMQTILGVETYQMIPDDGEGMFLMQVSNGEQKETFKYIVTK